MEVQTYAGLSHTLQTLAVASLILAVCLFFPRINYHAHLAKLPVVSSGRGETHRKAYSKSAKQMYYDGYQKFKDSVYRMATLEGEGNIVVPPRFLPELRKLPDDVLSFPKSVERTMEVKYTQILTDEPLVSHSVKADLTPALARLNPVVYSEVERALDEEMPPCEDWSAISIYSKSVDMVAKITGRIFVGPDLCRNQDYLDSAVNYTMDLIEATRAIKKIRPIFKPFLAPRLPEVQRLREREKMAAEYLEPIVQARRDAEANDPDWKRPDDMLSWFMARREDYGIDSTAKLAKLQLGIIFAAIHTTTLTVTNILYTLASTPEYIEPLREEIRKVKADNGGTITTRALQQMVKVDSYMKEVIRFYPAGFTSFNRKTLKGVTLSNGQYIPPGVIIEVPSWAIYQDAFPDGDSFDGFRHYKLRQGGTATDHARNQFVTTNETNLMFGYGRHACPGRFFAANEIKMLLANFILNYDFKNEDGSTTRYPNIEMGRSTTPDARKKLLFKRVQV